MADYYSKNPSELNNQPKKAIGDYVESNGILVPKRYKNVEEAKESGDDILCRSESIFEFNGPSGLLDSFPLTKDMKNVDDIKKGYFGEIQKDGSADPDHSWTRAAYYFCPMSNINYKEFVDTCSFSFWQKLKGYNRTVVADDAVKGRYHVITDGNMPTQDGKVMKCSAYSIIDNGIVNHIYDPYPESDKQLDGIVDFYESVRNLKRFDKNNCPIVEIQTLDKKHYFLQTLNGRDFSPADFKIKQESGTKALYTRGKTSPEGQIWKITTEFPKGYGHTQPVPLSDGYIKEVPNPDDFYFEMLAPRWKVAMLTAPFQDTDYTLENIIDIGHIGKSQLFKPQVSLILDKQNLMGDEGAFELTLEDVKNLPDADLILKIEELEKQKKEKFNGEPPYINVKVVSDGNMAFVERMN